MDPHWSGASAVVTGGARGQGAAITRLLLASGARVYVMDRLPLTEPAWNTLHDFAVTQPGELVSLQADVADDACWQDVAARVRGGDRALGALVNNAGITGPRNTVTQTVLTDWEQVLRVNLTGALLGIRALAPLMRRGASIINVSSTVGLTGYYSAAYSTSKWALRGLTKSAALELAGAGIRVNCVCPGVVDTDMIRTHAVLCEALRNTIPMQDMAAPEQIAEVLLFLLGPGASYITGADIAVDGGVSSGGTFLPVGKAVGAL